MIVLLLLLGFLFGSEPFTEWWKTAKEVCITGVYKNYDGSLREIKPFCCEVHRVEVKEVMGYFRNKFGIKEGLKVVASCRGAFFGVISYDGEDYAVSGKKGITKETPTGILEVINDREIRFKVCRGGADFTGCLSGVFAEGRIFKP
ncbi:hypothetical protein JCM9492_04040 [Aquifex pyrophilus]